MPKRLLLFLALALGSAFAQSPGPPSITTRELIAPVFTENPAPVSTLSTAVIGSGGPQTYYYWVVTNYTLGATSAYGPFPVSNAPFVLSSSNYITLVPAYIPGILSVDILRTSTPTQPSGSCTCAVATGVTSGAVNDQSNTLSSYTVNPVNVNQFTMTLRNEVIGAGVTHMLLRQNGVLVCDLSIGCGGSISAIIAGTGISINPSSPCTSGNCTINATGSGTPSLPLKSCQYNNTGSFGGAIGCNVTPAVSSVNPAKITQDNVGDVITVNSDWQFLACETGCVYSIAGSLGLTAGANTVTFPIVPPGVNGTDIHSSFRDHYLQITPAAGDTSPTEWAEITGGTAVGGSASGGTITFNAAYSHLPNYTIGSASTGIAEAISYATQITPLPGGTKIQLDPSLTYVCSAPVYLFSNNLMQVFDGQGAMVQNSSFADCLTIYSTSTDFYHIQMQPTSTFWVVSPSSPSSIPGNSATATLTIPTCPANFYANIPGQRLWLEGSSNGELTGIFGIGEYVFTINGGTCVPGLSNGTIAITQGSPYVLHPSSTLSPHDAGYTLSSNVGCYVVDGSNFNVHMHDIRFLSNAPGMGQGCEFEIWQDQAASADNIDMDAGFVTRKDQYFQGAGFFNAVTGAILNIGDNVNISEPAKAVEWDGGNDFNWGGAGGVVQNYAAGGIIIRHRLGGFGNFFVGCGVHFETGSSTPVWAGSTVIGDPLMLVNGGTPFRYCGPVGQGVTVGGSNSAPWPGFPPLLGGQTATRYYYLVDHNNLMTSPVCNTGGDCLSAPLFIGAASNTNPAANPVTVSWYAHGDNSIAGTCCTVSSYDLLAVDVLTSGTIGVPFPQAPQGTGAYLVSSSITPPGNCNIHGICSFVDSVAHGSLGSYSVNWLGTSKTWKSPIYNAPGNVALLNGATYIGPPLCVNTDGYFFNGQFNFNINPFLAEFTQRSLNSNDVQTYCPYIESPVSSMGQATQCYQTSDSSGNVPCSNNGSFNPNHLHVTIHNGRTSSTITTAAVTNWSRITIQQESSAFLNALYGANCDTVSDGPFTFVPTPGTGLVVTATTAPSGSNVVCLNVTIENN